MLLVVLLKKLIVTFPDAAGVNFASYRCHPSIIGPVGIKVVWDPTTPLTEILSLYHPLAVSAPLASGCAVSCTQALITIGTPAGMLNKGFNIDGSPAMPVVVVQPGFVAV